MKKLFALVSGVALLNIFIIAQAQSQDTALAKVDDSRKIKKEVKEQETTENISETSKQIKADELTTTPVEKFILPFQAIDEKRSILNTKVGPNGEELMMERNSYYYFDDKGNKVKAKLSELKEKPKRS